MYICRKEDNKTIYILYKLYKERDMEQQMNTREMTPQQQECLLVKAQQRIKDFKGEEVPTWDIIVYEWGYPGRVLKGLPDDTRSIVVRYKTPGDRRKREDAGLIQMVSEGEVTAYWRDKKLKELGI